MTGLEKRVFNDLISFESETKNVLVRQATVVYDNGSELSRSYHRHVVQQGDDLSKEDPVVVAICNAVWPETNETIQ